MNILAIDPGPTESAYIVIGDDCRAWDFNKIANADMLEYLRHGVFAYYAPDHIVIEMVASYGMAVGADVFQTCVWIGRFMESTAIRNYEPALTYRRDVKLHHCHNGTAGDSNIRQALVDRFAPGERNHGKGTKDAPGWFHGFRADIWQAFALAVYTADQLREAGAV